MEALKRKMELQAAAASEHISSTAGMTAVAIILSSFYPELHRNKDTVNWFIEKLKEYVHSPQWPLYLQLPRLKTVNSLLPRRTKRI